MPGGRPPANRPLHPRTEHEYSRALLHCFGSDQPPFAALRPGVASYGGRSRRLTINAAIRHAYRKAGLSDEAALAAQHLLPAEQWAPRKETEIPADPEIDAYERAVTVLPPGRRAAVLLPLRLGLRSEELLGLKRAWVERAMLYGELKILRKGGKEQVLPAQHVDKALFQELLDAPRATTLRRLSQQMAEARASLHQGVNLGQLRWAPRGGGGQWERLGEIFSNGNPKVQYNAFRAAVRKASEVAKVDLRPHKLRHVFATRMIKKKAPLPVVQWMLGHRSITTTMIYAHPEAADAAQYL